MACTSTVRRVILAHRRIIKKTNRARGGGEIGAERVPVPTEASATVNLKTISLEFDDVGELSPFGFDACESSYCR